MTPLWLALVIAAVGSYLLKLAGMSLPESLLNYPKVQRVAEFLPIAMLSALVAVELFDGGGRYAVDWRILAGVAAAISFKTGRAFEDVDLRLVRAELTRQGVRVA